MGDLYYQNPPPHSDDNTASEPPRGAAREYLERERRRAEAATHFRTTASEAATDKKTVKKPQTPFWPFAAVIIALSLVLEKFVGGGPTLLVGLFVFLVVLPYARLSCGLRLPSWRGPWWARPAGNDAPAEETGHS